MNGRIGTLAALLVLQALSSANANFHLYDFTEVYSNADGTIQFIELSAGVDGQHVLSGHSVTSGTNEFVFASNLSSNQTADTSFLMATAGFAALPGAVTPDFIIPDNFFSVHSDTLTLVGGQFPAISWSGGGLPVDGFNSLNRAIGGGGSTSVATNSPTNFAGDTGSIDLSVVTETFVDFAAPNGGDGTAEFPFNTFAEGVDAVLDGGVIMINAGLSTETLVVDVTKTFTVRAVGGNVMIGPEPVFRNGFRSRSSSR